MTVYECSNCKYRFTRPKRPQICPYCSKEGTLSTPQSAADLLKDIE